MEYREEKKGLPNFHLYVEIISSYKEETAVIYHFIERKRRHTSRFSRYVSSHMYSHLELCFLSAYFYQCQVRITRL